MIGHHRFTTRSSIQQTYPLCAILGTTLRATPQKVQKLRPPYHFQIGVLAIGTISRSPATGLQKLHTENAYHQREKNDSNKACEWVCFNGRMADAASRTGASSEDKKDTSTFYEYLVQVPAYL
jgi:hypothetical protein